jgi:hypothetical protein
VRDRGAAIPGLPRAISRRAATLALILAVAGAAGAAGCGGGSSGGPSAGQATARYIDEVNLAQRDFAAAVKPISAAITPTSPPRANRAALRRLAGAVRTLEQRLSAIAPPPKVASLQRELVAELASYGRAIERAVHRLASHRPRRLIAARQALLRTTRTAGARIDATLAALNARLH